MQLWHQKSAECADEAQELIACLDLLSLAEIQRATDLGAQRIHVMLNRIGRYLLALGQVLYTDVLHVALCVEVVELDIARNLKSKLSWSRRYHEGLLSMGAQAVSPCPQQRSR